MTIIMDLVSDPSDSVIQPPWYSVSDACVPVTQPWYCFTPIIQVACGWGPERLQMGVSPWEPH